MSQKYFHFSKSEALQQYYRRTIKTKKFQNTCTNTTPTVWSGQMFQWFKRLRGSAEGGRAHLGAQHGGGVGDGHHDLVDQLHGNVAHHADPLGVFQGHRLWKLALLSWAAKQGGRYNYAPVVRLTEAERTSYRCYCCACCFFLGLLLYGVISLHLILRKNIPLLHWAMERLIQIITRRQNKSCN